MRLQHWLAALLLLPATLTAPLTYAHGDVYFEFAPDAWASMRHVVSASETPYQLFEPSSAFTLTAYDLWVDNTGDAGPVTLTLADSEGTTLRTNSITLPSLPAVPGGNKLHVNLSSDLLLSASEQYSLKISSSLPGFGLYYADRIAFLGHNEATRGAYSYGAARLGQAVQSFSFKFSLRATPPAGATSGGEETGIIAASSTTTTPPQVTQQISISNARVISTTGNTVTLAWSTDIAADSRASVRSQLDPLYVVASGYDPTLELEHTLTISNLIPNVNYFADVFSSQGSELVLTTYTLSFKTIGAVTTPPPASTPSTPPPATPSAPTTTNPNPATTPSSQPTTPSNVSPTNGSAAGSQGASTPSAPAGVSVAENDDNGTRISWPAPEGGEPSPTSYRIDVFNSNRNLVRSIAVPAGVTSKNVPQLENGIHHAVVYAEQGGYFSKVAPAVTFLLQSNDMGLVWKIVLLVILWIVGIGGYFVWKFKKEKTVLPPEEGYDPNR